MDIDQAFMGVAVQLIQNVFPTPILYHRSVARAYNAATGEVTETITDYRISAGVLSRGRAEAGGTAETYELHLWVDHSSSGLPYLPTTADQITYDNVMWKVTTIDPSYSSKALIASKITCRNQ